MNSSHNTPHTPNWRKLLYALKPYCNVAYSMHWFFALTLAGIFAFIIIFARDTQAILLKQSQMPLVELYDFSIYQATNTGVETHIKGTKALRYAEYEQSFETILRKIQPSLPNAPRITEYIYGQEITRTGNIYTFNKGGVYAKNSGEVFYSKRAKYDAKNEIFTGIGAFWASSVEGSMEGQNIIYNQKLQTTTASSVTARIDLQAQKDKK